MPTITHEHVKWMRSKSAMYIRYFDERSGKWRHKSAKVEVGPGDDFDEKAAETAGKLEEFYLKEHSDVAVNQET